MFEVISLASCLIVCFFILFAPEQSQYRYFVRIVGLRKLWRKPLQFGPATFDTSTYTEKYYSGDELNGIVRRHYYFSDDYSNNRFLDRSDIHYYQKNVHNMWHGKMWGCAIHDLK